MKRRCAACSRFLDSTSFSRAQWGKSVENSTCISCVDQNQRSMKRDHGPTERKNDATRANFSSESLRNPFAEGGFRYVAKGMYTEGSRRGEGCVCKWFKSGFVYESTFYDVDIKAMREALGIIEQWNRSQFVNKPIRLNIPEVWQFTPESSRDRAHSLTLLEPYIGNYQKFNSNTGWADESTPWPRVMQALSHFSFHVSGGQLVLCDLQGGIYSNGVVLTDPVILSRQQGRFGVTDLGPKGISTFFAEHTCNEYCKSTWQKPTDQSRYHLMQQGTSMMNVPKHVPSYAGKQALTQG